MYTKPTASYKMSKASKIYLGTIRDAHLRGELKRSIIQADLEASVRPRSDKKSNVQDRDED